MPKPVLRAQILNFLLWFINIFRHNDIVLFSNQKILGAKSTITRKTDVVM